MSELSWTVFQRNPVQPLSPEEWAAVAAEHDMKCGMCRPGMLRLHAVRGVFTFGGFTKDIRVELRCDNPDCTMQIEMPPHTREQDE